MDGGEAEIAVTLNISILREPEQIRREQLSQMYEARRKSAAGKGAPLNKEGLVTRHGWENATFTQLQPMKIPAS